MKKGVPANFLRMNLGPSNYALEAGRKVRQMSDRELEDVVTEYLVEGMRLDCFDKEIDFDNLVDEYPSDREFDELYRDYKLINPHMLSDEELEKTCWLYFAAHAVFSKRVQEAREAKAREEHLKAERVSRLEIDNKNLKTISSILVVVVVVLIWLLSG